MNEYSMLINGQLVDGEGPSIDVINPANENLITSLATASEAQLQEAVKAARQAFGGWANTSLTHRQGKLRQLAALIVAHIDDLVDLLVKEQGKPREAAKIEVDFSTVFIKYFVEQSLEHTVLIDDEAQRVELVRKPLGVVAGIAPWNYPFLIAVYKLVPAVVTGNSIILKPSPMTPLTTLKLGELVNQVFPAGVVNVLADDNRLGPLLTAHKDIAKITFTGSTLTGKKIMANSAHSLKRLTLELGGNDAGIVLDDANPKEFAPKIFASAFMNSGQVCAALKRLYVHDSLYDEVCEEIAQLARSAVVGNGDDPRTQFGPVQNRAQYKKMCRYIEEANQYGTVIAGGTIPEGPGFILPLTVVRDIVDGTKLVDEEPFGPILPIIRYSDIDDVVSRANSSTLGLGGSVWSSNIKRAQDVAARLECGTSWINQHAAFAPTIPFPTCKQSGIGVEWGVQGLEEFTRLQVINTAKE